MFEKLALVLTTFSFLPAQLPFMQKENSAIDSAIVKRPAIVRVVTGCGGRYVFKDSKESKKPEYEVETKLSGTGFLLVLMVTSLPALIWLQKNSVKKVNC
jgi:hypothetical protein